MTSLQLKLTRKDPLSPRITRFRFEHPRAAELPAFSGGAHVMVEMRDGERLHRNAYSLISDPSDRTGYEIAVQREDGGRGGSRFMHGQTRIGMVMNIGLPVNLFALDLTARKHLLIAGGVGVTPFLAQIPQLARLGAAYELHYAVRRREELAALPLLPAGAAVHVHVGAEGRRLDLAALLAAQPLGTHLYVCASERMIRAARETALAQGWPQEAVHSEQFLAPAPGEPFEVHCAASDRTLSVGAEQSLLEALEAAGIETPWLCRGGACGQCETAVLACDGSIEHRDHWLEPAERASRIMPCVSRFRGRLLTIDR